MRGLVLVTNLLASLLLSGCSAIQFAYNRADWFLASRFEEQVSASDENQKLLENLLSDALEDNRRSMLPKYAAFLESRAEELQTSFTNKTIIPEPRVAIWANELDTLLDETIARTLPQAKIFFSKLSPEEISSLETRSRKKISDTRKERLEESPNARKRRRLKQTRRVLEYFTGELEAYQIYSLEKVYQDWPENGWPLWLDFRDRALDELLKALRSGSALKRDEFLTLWLTKPETFYAPELVEWNQEARGRQIQLITDLLPTLTRVQRTRLLTRLRQLAQDFQELHNQK